MLKGGKDGRDKTRKKSDQKSSSSLSVAVRVTPPLLYLFFA
jgi:hypothetical protein